MKIEFNLGWILAIAAALVVAAMGFISFYYLTGGDLTRSAIVAGCLLVIPVVIVMLLVPAKECNPGLFHPSAVKEAVLLGIMLVLLIASMSLVNHFFTVSGRTDTIDKAVMDQNQQAKMMSQGYKAHVEGRLENWGSYLILRNVKDVDINVEAMKDSILPAGLDTIGSVSGGKNLSWWQLPRMMKNVEQISAPLEALYNTLQKYDKSFNKDGMAGKWTYEYTKAEDLMSHFTASEGFISNLWTVVSVLIAYLLILLPYFAADRDSRSKGLWNELFKNGYRSDDSGFGTV